MQPVAAAGFGRQSDAAADVVGVTVRVDYGFELEIFFAQQVPVRLEVTQRIDDDGYAFAGYDVTQASARGPAYLIDCERRSFDY